MRSPSIVAATLTAALVVLLLATGQSTAMTKEEYNSLPPDQVRARLAKEAADYERGGGGAMEPAAADEEEDDAVQRGRDLKEEAESNAFIPEDSVALAELWAMLNSSDAGLSDGLTVGRRGRHGVRGLFASKRVVAGTPLAVLPNAAILSEVTLPADRIAPFAFCQGLNDLTPQILLALLLTEERADPHSRWAPYLSLLPEHFTSLPLFWPNELAGAWLHDSEAATLVRGQARTFLSEFRVIQQCEAVADRFKHLDLETYIW